MSRTPSAGGGGAARQRHPCRLPVVHYPYQNWYFLPGPAGPGASVLKLPLVFVFVVFLLCGCRSWLCGFHPAQCSQPQLFFVILLRLGKKRGKKSREEWDSLWMCFGGMLMASLGLGCPSHLSWCRAGMLLREQHPPSQPGPALRARATFAALRRVDAAVVPSGM